LWQAAIFRRKKEERREEEEREVTEWLSGSK